VLLAGVGIYGVMSYAVTRRTREIGVRMALGAARADVMWLVLGQSLRLIVVGVAAGLLGAMAVTGSLAGLLFGVTPRDPVTLVITSVTFAAIATVAAYLPARRATRVDPLVALRYE
jgi:putative ABC transport system permease protein